MNGRQADAALQGWGSRCYLQAGLFCGVDCSSSPVFIPALDLFLMHYLKYLVVAMQEKLDPNPSQQQIAKLQVITSCPFMAGIKHLLHHHSSRMGQVGSGGPYGAQSCMHVSCCLAFTI